MISLKYTQQQFNNFIKKYDTKNERVQLKIAHMIRVMNINIQFAQWQNLDKENVELAGIIGLLHDIGRFVQIEKYNTFIDSESIDHCQAGVDLLFKENLISYFIDDSKYYTIIEKAILNHGKIKIESNLDKKTLIHCKLIRDSDKTDIYEVMLRENPDVVFDGIYLSNAEINPKVLIDFYKHSLIKKSDIQTVLDDYVRKVAFIYNYYFDINLRYIKDKDYITRMTTRFLDYFHLTNIATLDNIDKIKKYGNAYINNK